MHAQQEVRLQLAQMRQGLHSSDEDQMYCDKIFLDLGGPSRLNSSEKVPLPVVLQKRNQLVVHTQGRTFCGTVEIVLCLVGGAAKSDLENVMLVYK